MGFFSRIMRFFSPSRSSGEGKFVSGNAWRDDYDKVRARDTRGRYRGDDPDTEEDEAWVEVKKNT